MKTRSIAALLVAASATLVADEGMWRIDQLPLDAIAQKYGVRLTASDLDRLRFAPVRISSGGGGGTGTFASANGLVLTNHHVALDCIRTSTLAEQNKGRADNLIEQGFTAKSASEELACKRFRVQIERSARDVTAEVNADVKPGMPMADLQRLRQARRSDLERGCRQERGASFSCNVVDFNSGAWSLLIVYEDFNDVRLVYAPEKQLGYFGGDEMNFRFPRYVSDISILRVYVEKDGSHGEFDAAHVPYRPAHYLRVTMQGIKEGDPTFVSGNPGNTNRYRISNSAVYNLQKGMPNQIREMEAELALLKKHAAARQEHQVLLQERIFSISNSLKYTRDVLAALGSSGIVADQQARERQFTAFLATRPDLGREYATLFDDHTRLYARDVEVNADLDAAIAWIQKASAVGYGAGIYEFALERAKTSDRDREPQFQERNWPDVRRALLDEEPVIPALEEDLLTIGFEKALALPSPGIPAVRALVERSGGTRDPRALARSLLQGSQITSAGARKTLIDASTGALEGSTDAALIFARQFLPTLGDQRGRIRVLNETLYQHRAAFARGLAAWRGRTMYPDANFTLRATYGAVAGYRDSRGRNVPFTTTLGDMYALAQSRKNEGEFAMPATLLEWRKKLGDATFAARYAALPVNFVTTNDITGGNSGSSTLNGRLEIVGLIFDGNEEAMASDWAFSSGAARALSTDVRFALTLAREVHGAGWIVDELIK